MFLIFVRFVPGGAAFKDSGVKLVNHHLLPLKRQRNFHSAGDASGSSHAKVSVMVKLAPGGVVDIPAATLQF